MNGFDFEATIYENKSAISAYHKFAKSMGKTIYMAISRSDEKNSKEKN